MDTPLGMPLTRHSFLRLLLGGAAATSVLPLLGGVRSANADGKVLKISFRSSIKRLDPAFTISGDEYVATQALYDNLTRLDASFKVQPGLAEEWSSPDGAKTWNFKLRKGVMFHHGRELDAEDVAFSIRRVLDKAVGSPGQKAIGPIAEISAVDPTTVKVVLQGPFADFPAIMSQTFARIVPRDKAENLDQQPIGTGPFKFVEWMSGQHVRLARNPTYWEPGSPVLEEVWLVSYPAQAAEQAALSSGGTQMMWEVPPALVTVVTRMPNVTVTEIPSMGFQPIAMRSDRPPFDDPRVRRAVKHAIDRERVMRLALHGRGTVAHDSPVPPASVFRSDVASLPFDPAQARSLLKEAGHAAGLQVQLFASNERAGCIETAQVVKPMLEAVGIKVDVQQRPWDRFLSEVWSKETFFVSNWLGRPTIDEQLYPFFHSTGSWNEYHYSNPELDKLLDGARQETDEARRRQLYAKAQEIIVMDGPAIVPYFANYATATAKGVADIPVHPLKWVDLRKASLKA